MKHVVMTSDGKKFNLDNRQKLNNELTEIKKVFIEKNIYRKKYIKERIFILKCSTRKLSNKDYDFELLEGKIIIW